MMQKGLIAAGIAFAITLAVVIGNKLSSESLAVIVGAVCGLAASIPVSIGVVIASSQNWGRETAPREIEYDYATHRYAAQPPVVFIAPPQAMASPYGYATPLATPMASPYTVPPNMYALPANMPTIGAPPREFKIIGGEE